MDSSTMFGKQENKEPANYTINDDTLNQRFNALNANNKRSSEEDRASASKKDPKSSHNEGLGYIAKPLWFLQTLPPLQYVPPPPSKEEPVECPEPLSIAWNPDNAGVVPSPVRTSARNRQFWKAGDFTDDDKGDNYCAFSSSVGMDHVRVHPKFLHSNATSHKWVLGAFAELLDNSLDEVCNGATYVKVDMLSNEKDGSKMLLVEDDGGGMNPEKTRQCMSLGYSAKSKQANAIGQYGNGFKTSSMRLGADVIVFTRSPGTNSTRPTQTIGMLSYSFLRGTGKEDIIVPMIDYEKDEQGWKAMTRNNYADFWNRNLETIAQWSPYSTEEQLLLQFDSIKDHGTRIVIYNLWEDDQEQLELDFDADPYDIQIRGVNRDENKIQMAKLYPNSRHYLTYRHSLRTYSSILYLRLPQQFRMYLRGKEIEHHNIVNDMTLTNQLTYKPHLDGIVTKDSNIFADVTIGFVKDARYHIDVQGFNVYHKNRLIRPFWRVWNASGSGGRGIIGVLEANFVEPAHDKQGLSEQSCSLDSSNDYLKCKKATVGYIGSSSKKYLKKTTSKNQSPSSTATSNKISQEELKPFVEPVKVSESPERQPMENNVNQLPKAVVDLRNEINCARETRKSLETNLEEARKTLIVLDEEQVTLIETLIEERTERDKEHERLKDKLNEAYKTIDELSEKVRQLEAMNGLIISCKEEK